MNNVEKLKRVREALHNIGGNVYHGMADDVRPDYPRSPDWQYVLEQVKIGKKSLEELIDQQSEPAAMRYGWDGYGYRYIDNSAGSDWQTRHKDAEPLYTIGQSKGVDVLTEVEMVQVAGILFNAGHEELSKKAYSALKAGQPKAPSVDEGELAVIMEALNAAPVYVTKDGTWLNLRPDANKSKGGAMLKIEQPESEAIQSFAEKVEKAKATLRALSERGVITTNGEGV